MLVTGGAGFIGSNLVDRLLQLGHTVTVYDNFSTGQPDFLADARRQPGFRLVQADLLDEKTLGEAMVGQDVVFHLAANADVRFGTEHPRKDLEQNTIATYNVLEAMRAANVRRLVFASTGAVYGEQEVFPTPETGPFPVQNSLYGASKVAAEGMITAYCVGFGMQALIFRFVSILGERYTHGHVFDFYKKLLADPTSIEVLGNGRQRKSYLYIQDCVNGILHALEKYNEPVGIFNLGADTYCNVDESLGWICEQMGLNPTRHYTGGDRGWIGDSPFIFLDNSRLRSLGWEPRLSIKEAVLKTLEYLQSNPALLERRA